MLDKLKSKGYSQDMAKVKQKYQPRNRESQSFVFCPTLLGSKKNTMAVRRFGSKVGIGPSAKSKAVKDSLQAEIMQAWGPRPQLIAPYSVTVYLARTVRQDIDNACGHLFDCLQSMCVIDNDKNVISLTVHRAPIDRSIVLVQEISEMSESTWAACIEGISEFIDKANKIATIIKE